MKFTHRMSVVAVLLGTSITIAGCGGSDGGFYEDVGNPSGNIVNLSLGTGQLMEDESSTRYDKPYNVLVTDGAGRPIQNAEVRFTIETIGFRKGSRSLGIDAWVDSIEQDCVVSDPGTDNPGAVSTVVIDPGTTTSGPGRAITDATGFADIYVRYAKQYATWTTVRLTATSTVGSVTGRYSVDFPLPITLSDIEGTDPPPGIESPFGPGVGVDANCSLNPLYWNP